MSATLLALCYSIVRVKLGKQNVDTPVERQDDRIVAIILEASVIGVFVGGGYLLALLMNLENPYWVPISTAAVLQGATFRAVWHRNVHRIVGTFIGMGLAWIIFSMSPGVWALAVLIGLLSFAIEMLVTRNYGLAVIFITPLTVIFADASLAAQAPEALILTRLVDIVIGSMIGYVGGWVIHHPKLFQSIEQFLVKR